MLLSRNEHTLSMAFFVCNSETGSRHEIRRQMAVYLDTQQTVTQSKTMVQFSFGFTDSSFLQLNGQNLLRSEDLISNINKKELNKLIKNGEDTDIVKLSHQYL